MKKALAILLTFSILAQGMINLALCAYYQINKNEIAAKFCVNKNKPMLHCNGQCYLGKQLKKAEENEKRQNQTLREKDEVISAFNKTALPAYTPSYTHISNLLPYQGKYLSAPHLALLQPPRV